MARPTHGLRQELATRQQMLLLPQMLQSLELLALPSTEIETWLGEQAESNEALLLHRAEEPGPLPTRSRQGARESGERHEGWLEQQPDRSAGLTDLVEEQLALLDIRPERARWVRWLASELDPNGFLSLCDEELYARARAAGLARAATPGEEERELGELGVAIATLQQLEPRGLGARNAVEALLLQLDPRDPDYALLARMLEEFLGEIAHHRLRDVARALGVDAARLDELLAQLRGLDPAPGRGLVDECPPSLRPEVLVEARDDGGFDVRLDSSAWPTVEIDPAVEELARTSGRSSPLARYLRPKIESARSIQGALAQRQRTLARVAAALFAHQAQFLVHGPGGLAPLRMGALADELGLALSTVSRAISGKHAQTPWGILPLRWFFQAGAGGVEGQTRDVLREAVRELFAGEDPRTPLSDDEALARLSARGFVLARRTLAKYRSELGIASSYQRKRGA